MDTQSLALDLDVLLYAIRSSKEAKLDLESISNEIFKTKRELININPLFNVFESFFSRNNTPDETKNAYYQKELDSCLIDLRHKTTEILESLQHLSMPIPDWFMSQIIMVDSNIENEELNFEIKLFNWITGLKVDQMNVDDLRKLKSQEGFDELNLSIPPNQKLHGFLPFHVIIDEWKYKNLRMHRNIDTLINKEWPNLLTHLTVRIDFLTGKVGIIIVTSKA